MRRVLGFGTYDVASHPRVEVLLEGLRRTPGNRVLELDEPLGLSTADRVAILKQPWRLPVLAGRLASRWSRLAAGSRRYRGSRRPDALLVGYMGHFDVLLARLLYPRTTIILDHLIFASGTARDRGEGGAKARLLSVLDRLATHSADVVVLDTVEHAAKLDDSIADRGVIVPVGAPASWYAAGQSATAARTDDDGVRDAGRPLTVVFFGLFTPLQGTPYIAQALRRLAEQGVPVRALLIGSGQDRAACEQILAGSPAAQVVEWRDWVDSADLPRVVAEHDVCLGIVGTTDKALDVVPNKVYQGLAAGCAVITSDTAPQRRLLGDGAVFVPPGDPRALADALAHLATDPAALQGARERAAAAAASFVPEQAVAPLVAALERSRIQEASR
ncbi:MAG: glycosyltransferase [Actinomyces ruminicola]|uniref:Glycosyltransferase involved in cell wall bisynthesis n=1 Tax=Actinomyces ruminicola TaxID=332524 RepID=A0A1G9SKP2_9ACTO|nr:glycosyltransferase [Actinomyces ruminicola]MBE6482880.1 glycosyltransferase [Actinomyces ruminicola]SDM36048.1 Glycosyltransferase involved in cell wall bisynthesis [Actinomyces ruminicola]